MNSDSAMTLEGVAAAGAPHGCESEASLLERSSLYREFIAEREEILRHKWIESEKAGRDIGFECALVSWVIHHCALWRFDTGEADIQCGCAFIRDGR